MNKIWPSLRGPIEQEKLLWFRDGKQLEHHGINHAEYRRICADAEGEGENRDNGKSGVSTQLAEAVAQILDQGFEPLETPGGAHVFFDQRGVAQRAAGGVGGF